MAARSVATSGKSIVGILAAAAIAIVVAYFGVRNLRADPEAATSSAAAASHSQAAAKLRITLDPQLFQGNVRKAYEVAGRAPGLLAQMHCYCGCDRTEGHKNLLDCFRDKHGSTCPICVGEALEAEKLTHQGMPVDQIRDALRVRYTRGG